MPQFGSIAVWPVNVHNLIKVAACAVAGAVALLLAPASVPATPVESVPVGAVVPFAGSTLPGGYLWANGQAVSRSTYGDLFAAIGTTYGAGDGSTTFNLPDTRRRIPLGKAASGTGSTLGATGGTFDHAHGVASHAHPLSAAPNHQHGAAHSHRSRSPVSITRPCNCLLFFPETSPVLDWGGTHDLQGVTTVTTNGYHPVNSTSMIEETEIVTSQTSPLTNDVAGVAHGGATAPGTSATSSANAPYRVVSHIVKALPGSAAPCGAVWAAARGSATRGSLDADGQAVSRSTYSGLFSCIGTAFGGGDGSTTFNVPDLRGRFAQGRAASGTASSLNEAGGALDHTHTAAHGHGIATDGGHAPGTASHTHSFRSPIGVSNGYLYILSPHDSHLDGLGTYSHVSSPTDSVFAPSGGWAPATNGPIEIWRYTTSASAPGTTTAGAHAHGGATTGTTPSLTGSANPPFQVVDHEVDTGTHSGPSAGTITPYAGATTPAGWLLADGRAVSRSTYPYLFAVIGTTYGAGDGSTTFNLPDLRQRMALGRAASGTGSTLGGTGGSIDHAPSLASHSHGLSNEPDHQHTLGSHAHQYMSPLGLNSGRIQFQAPYDGHMDNLGSLDFEYIAPSAVMWGGLGTGSDLTELWQATTTYEAPVASPAGGHGHTVGSATPAIGAANPPFLTVNYLIKVNSGPDTTQPSSPAAGVVTTNKEPTLAGLHGDRDSGDTATLEFQMCGDSGCGSVVRSGSAASVAAGATGSWQVSPALPSGPYWWRVRAVDAAGEASYWSGARSIRLDTAPATPTLLDPADLYVTPDATPDLRARFDDADSSDRGTVEFQVCSSSTCSSVVTGGTSTSVVAGADAIWTVSTALTSGTTYHWRARATDEWGVQSGWSATRQFTVDTTAPGITDNQAGDATWRTSNSGSYDVDFSDNLDLARFETRVWTGAAQGGTMLQDWTQASTLDGTSYTTNWALLASTWSALQEGTSYVTVRASDTAGNTTVLVDAFSVRKDTVVPPAVSTLSSPSPVNGSRLLSWSTVSDATSGTAYYRVFRSTSSGTLGAQVNANGATTGGSYTDAAALADGTYYYTVRAVDDAGLVNATSSNNQVAVVLSTTLPTVTDNQPGDTAWRSANTSTYDVDFSDDIGLARFETRAWSGAGGSGTRLQDWTQVSALGGTSYTANWALPASTWSALPDGISYVSVRLTDTAGNQRTVVDVFEVRKDTVVPPAVTTLNTPSPVNGNRTLSWSTVTDATSGTAFYRVHRSTASGTLGPQINADGATTSGSHADTSALADGTYYYTVRAVDRAGLENTSASNSQGSVVLSTTLPTITDNQPGDVTWRTSNSGSYDVDFADDLGLASFETRVWTGAAASGTQLQPWTQVATPGGTSYTTNWSLLASTWSALQQGTNHISVRLTDTAGNQRTLVDAFEVRKDTVAPAAPASVGDGTSGNATWQTGASSLSANWAAVGDATSGLNRYEVCFSATTGCGGTPVSGWQSAGTAASVTRSPLSLVHGTTYFGCVRAVDEAGLVGSPECSDGVTVDTQVTAPVVGDGSSGDAAYLRSTSTIAANWPAVDDTPSGVDRYQYCVSATTGCGGTPVVGWTDNATATSFEHDGLTLQQGTTYYACVRVYDDAGNTATGCSSGVYVDSLPPDVPDPSTMSPSDGVEIQTVPTFAAVYEDALPPLTGRIDFRIARDEGCTDEFAAGSSASALASGDTGSWTPSALPAGLYWWCARGVDDAGNASAWSRAFELLLNYPPRPGALAAPADGAWVIDPLPQLSAMFDDPDADATGHVVFELCATSACGAPLQSGTSSADLASGTAARWAPLDELADGGPYYWRARGIDQYDSRGAWSSTRSFRVDATPPPWPADARTTLGGSSSITLAWEAVTDSGSGLAWYEVEASLNGGTWTPLCVTTTLTCTYAGLSSGSNVTFRLRAADVAGGVSRWTHANDTAGGIPAGTRPTTPALLEPSDGELTSRTPRLQASYDHAAGVQGIVEFQVARDTSFTVEVHHVVSGRADSGAMAAAVLQELVGSGTWYFRARAIDAQGRASTWSARRAFVPTVAPERPVNGAPADGDVLATAGGQLVATAFSDADDGSLHAEAEWQVREQIGNYLDPFWSARSGGRTSTELTARLEAGARYSWRVRYRDELGAWSAWSRETSFNASADAGPGETAGGQLTITSPLDGTLVSSTPTTVTGTVTGSVADRSLTVNGVPVRPAADGSFRASIVLSSSPATISAVATGLSGTTTRTSVTVEFRAITFYGSGSGTLSGNGLSNVLDDGDGATHVLCGVGGRDVVRAGGGDDFVDCVEPFAIASRNADTVDCGAGDDRAHVDIFDRVVNCERVTRVWMGAAPRDSFRGSAENDWFLGMAGPDRISCRSGSDQVSSGSGNDVVRCSDPARVARRSRDTIECGAGKRDRAYVDYHDRTVGCEIVIYELVGTDGLDRLRATHRNELIYGLRGNDRISCGVGRDVAYGGIGDDTIDCADRVPSRQNRDIVECGVGPRDRAVVDRYDLVRGCEHVVRR